MLYIAPADVRPRNVQSFNLGALAKFIVTRKLIVETKNEAPSPAQHRFKLASFRRPPQYEMLQAYAKAKQSDVRKPQVDHVYLGVRQGIQGPLTLIATDSKE